MPRVQKAQLLPQQRGRSREPHRPQPARKLPEANPDQGQGETFISTHPADLLPDRPDKRGKLGDR